MPASTMMPDVTVEIAFTTAPSDPNPAWQDVSDYVEAVEGIDITRGRADELSQIQPSTLAVTLDNRDGRFTPERTASPYYPNVKKSKRIRVNARWPLGGNFVTNSSFETDSLGWSAIATGYSGGGSIRRAAATGTPDGTASAQFVWPTSVGGSLFGTSVGGLVIDRTYTASAYVFVSPGQPDVRLTCASIGSSAFTSAKDTWLRISLTFVATATSHVIGIEAVNTTAAQVCYTDAVMVEEGSTVGTFTTNPPPIYRRFSGYIDEWPLEWPDGTSTVARSRITATSRQARMAKGAELRSIIECEYLQDNPTAYYTFGDPAGTTQAGNTSTSVQPPMTATRGTGTGGSITFGTATGPGTDDLTAATFTRVDPNANGFYMRSIHGQDIVRGSDTSLLMECFFSSTTVDGALMSVRTDTGAPAARESILSITAAGNLQGVVAAGSTGAFYISIVSAATVTDGATHHAALRETISGGTVTLTLFLDGVSVGSSSNAGSWLARDVLCAGGIAPVFNGVMAHVAVYSGTTEITSDRILQHALSGLTGFSGERSDQRIARLARYAGVPVSEVATETGLSMSLVNQLTGGAQPIALMQDVTKTESGNLFDAGNGMLTFQARSHRYVAAPSLTLSAALQEIEGGLNPRLDDQGMANDITASRAAGATVRVLDTASITDHGLYRDDLPLLTTDDAEVTDVANWNLSQRSVPLMRIPTCSVDLLNASTSQKTALLGLELGSLITLAGLPTQAPAASLDFFVEGIVEKFGDESYVMTFNLSPANPQRVWQLDTTTYSVLDSTTRLAY